MSFKVRKSGAWADTGTVNVRKSGAWATAGFVKAMKSGSWALVWPVLAASLTTTDVTSAGASGAGATSIYRVDSDGLVYKKIGAGSFTSFETWLDAGVNTQFEVRFTETFSNGEGVATGTFGTWLALTSDRDVTVNGAGVGNTATRIYTVEIRETLTNTVLTSVSITLNAERL